MKGLTNAVRKRRQFKRAYAAPMLCVTAAISLSAQTFTTLHSFDGTDGQQPYANLFQAANGNLYGTTTAGGASGSGTVFMITQSGALTTLHSFHGNMDGAAPYGGLVQASSGDLYGTTVLGGAYAGGTLFKITPGGMLTTLHQFKGATGSAPHGRLIQAMDGDLYGTTFGGGANGAGTVFRITLSGTLTTLYSFCAQNGCMDGGHPDAGLIQAANGDFYGTTSGIQLNSYGTVFKITASGGLTTIHNFCSQGGGCADGQYPEASLVQAAKGYFYGTTSQGGANQAGTIFKITSDGTLATVYNFCSLGACADGTYPYGDLIQASDGDLYGTTYYGGDGNSGTVYQLTPSGALTVLHSFCVNADCSGGQDPYAGIIQATNGNFYGTTYYGGASQDGVVFSLSVGLSPFVRVQPASGHVNGSVEIWGSVNGATSVSFNGTPASFEIVSSSEILAHVPTGASSGPVQVVTPQGTLLSNKPFRVLP